MLTLVTNNLQAATGLKSVGAHRLAQNDFSDENWMHLDYMRALFNDTDITSDEVFEFHNKIEAKWQAFWNEHWDGA